MPDWTPDLRRRLASLRLAPSREAEIVEEVSQHLDARYEELRANGATESDARRLALDELSEPGALADELRPLRQANATPPFAPGAPRRFLPADLAQDLRYAMRMLRRQPGFAAAAIVTLALGIGVNSAIFALVDATLLRPLPLPSPDRLVMVWEQTPTTAQGRVSPSNLADWNARTRAFERLAGFSSYVGGMVLAGADGTAETVPRQWVTAGFFDALGVAPIAGRVFQHADDVGRIRSVVLTESFWRSRFGADPALIGRDIRLDGESYVVVGVVPDEAQLLGRTSLWALAPIQDAPPRARGAYIYSVVGRMKPGVPLAAATADLRTVADALAQEFPATNAGRSIAVSPLHDAVIGSELRQTSLLFLAVVAFVLLICCANVGNLLLARATVRTRELAIRSALGADRARVIRQLLTESLVLAIIGGALGLAVGAALLAAAPSILPAGLLPPAVALTFDLRVVTFCAAAALLVGLLFGLAPAWRATALAPARTLATEGRTMTGHGGWLRTALVAGEVATAVVLLFGAGLLLRTLLAVEHVDRGYEAESVLTMIVDPLGSRYPTDELLMQFYAQVEGEVRAVPGVRDVAWASTLPLGPSYNGRVFFGVEGDPPPDEPLRPTADLQIISPSYFRTVDLPLVAGRGFDRRDAKGAVPVCIVNEAFVRGHLRGRQPIGMRIALRPTGSADASPVVREIVGVARQVKARPDETEDLVQVYVPIAQAAVDDIFLVVRPESGRADALAPAVRAAIGRVDTDQLVSVRSIMTLEQVAWEATSRHRFRAVLVIAFAGLALLLAMVGLFGILAYSVQQRTRDFGVRRALGATTPDILRPVVAGALRVIGAGALVGLVLATMAGRVIANLLFGVEPLDPLTFALVIAVLAVTAVAAVVGPAWRAAQVDPVVALRSE